MISILVGCFGAQVSARLAQGIAQALVLIRKAFAPCALARRFAQDLRKVRAEGPLNANMCANGVCLHRRVCVCMHKPWYVLSIQCVWYVGCV